MGSIWGKKEESLKLVGVPGFFLGPTLKMEPVEKPDFL